MHGLVDDTRQGAGVHQVSVAPRPSCVRRGVRSGPWKQASYRVTVSSYDPRRLHDTGGFGLTVARSHAHRVVTARETAGFIRVYVAWCDCTDRQGLPIDANASVCASTGLIDASRFSTLSASSRRRVQGWRGRARVCRWSGCSSLRRRAIRQSQTSSVTSPSAGPRAKGDLFHRHARIACRIAHRTGDDDADSYSRYDRANHRAERWRANRCRRLQGMGHPDPALYPSHPGQPSRRGTCVR